jgi:Holliday junction resolvasome RuvABC endonuclease subunit
VGAFGIDASLTGTGLNCMVSDKGKWVTTFSKSLTYPKELKGKSSFSKSQHIAKAACDLIRTQMTLMPERKWVIVLEGLAFGNKHSLVAMVEIATAIKMGLQDLQNVDILLCPPNVLKKFVTGNGAATKDLMLKEAYKKFGFDYTDNDENDAACLALLGLCHLDSFVMPAKPSAVRAALDKLEKLQ